MEIKVGMRIRAIQDYHPVRIGMTGTVLTYNDNFYPSVGIQFDNWQEGHDLQGKLEDFSGFFLHEYDIAPMESELITQMLELYGY